jgi:hypothetical protein
MVTFSLFRQNDWNRAAKLIVAAAFLSQSCFANDVESSTPVKSTPFFYTVKKKDSLNKVLRSFGIRPVWGAHGAVVKMISVNAFLQARNNSPDLVFPNEKVQFDPSFNDLLQDRKDHGVIEISESGEVDFNCSKEGLEQWVVLRKELEPDMDPFDRHYSTLAIDCKDRLGVEVRSLASDAAPVVVPVVVPVEATPPAAAAPTPAPIQPVPPEENSSVFEVSAGVSYMGVNGLQTSNQTTGNLVSDLVPSIDLSWKQLWNDEVFSHVYFSGRSISFESDMRGTPILNSNIFNSALGVGVGEKFSERLSGLVDFELAQTIFYQGLTGGSIQVNQVPLFRLHPKAEYGLLRRRHFLLSGLLGASYYSSSSYGSYSINSGYGFDAGFRLSQELKRSEFNCQLGYGARYQNTSYLNITEQTLGLSCGFGWGM